jgi:hypothetical protein
MVKLRAELLRVKELLLRSSTAGGAIELDAVGEALGTMAVSTDEIDALLHALEAAGRTIAAPTGPGAEQNLKRVVGAARTLKTKLARRPTLAEVASEAELTAEQVLVALALVRVMQR